MPVEQTPMQGVLTLLTMNKKLCCCRKRVRKVANLGRRLKVDHQLFDVSDYCVSNTISQRQNQIELKLKLSSTFYAEETYDAAQNNLHRRPPLHDAFSWTALFLPVK